MDKQKQQLVMVVGLLGVLGLSMAWNLGLFRSHKRPSPVPEIVSEVKAGAVTATKTIRDKVDNIPIRAELADRVKQMDKVGDAIKLEGSAGEGESGYAAANLRDPFKTALPDLTVTQPAGRTRAAIGGGEVIVDPAAAEPAARMPQLAIRGVIWGDYEPVVMIDNGVYKVGDVVRGVTIKAIGREGVTMEFKGVTAVMPLKKGL